MTHLDGGRPKGRELERLWPGVLIPMLALHFFFMLFEFPPLIPALPFCHLELKAERPKSVLYPDELVTYGDHVRARRLDAGLSQRQAAEAIGVDETSVFNWESNRIQPAVRLIPNIIRFLGYCPYTPGLPVSERLKLVRQSVGYSQQRTAQMLGIDEGTWRRWEAGQRQPSLEHMVRIESFLKSLMTSSSSES